MPQFRQNQPVPADPATARSVEIRALPVNGLEIRQAEDGSQTRTLTGYAVIYDSWSVVMGDGYWRMKEKIAPGAFRESLAAPDHEVYALDGHSMNNQGLLARRSKGTLRLFDDARGLRVEIDLPETRAADDLIGQIKAKNIEGQSFGFRVLEDVWREFDSEENRPDERTIIRAELIEVSPTGFPAYTDTTLAQRSLEKARQQPSFSANSRSRLRLAQERRNRQIKLDQ